MSVAFVQQSVPMVDEAGRANREWYEYLQDAYQLSGLAGSQNPLWESVAASGPSLLADSTNPPTQRTISGIIEGWSFDFGAEDTAHAILTLPNTYVPGSPWHPFVQWMPSDAGAGNVAWEFNYSTVVVDQVASAVTLVALTDAAAGAALTNQYVEGDAISVSGLGIGATILCSITRNGIDATDTYGGDAYLTSVGVKCMQGGVGAVTRWPPV